MKLIQKIFLPTLLAFSIFVACASAQGSRAEMHGPNGRSVVNIPKSQVDDDTTPVKTTLSWLDFESGYALAKKENKILLIDVYTDWCGWCKVMDRKTYTNDTIIRKLNKSFVMVKLNPEKDRTYTFDDKTMGAAELHQWLGYGKTFGFPSTYFMIEPGKSEERYTQVGYLDPWDFAGILDIILSKRK